MCATPKHCCCVYRENLDWPAVCNPKTTLAIVDRKSVYKICFCSFSPSAVEVFSETMLGISQKLGDTCGVQAGWAGAVRDGGRAVNLDQLKINRVKQCNYPPSNLKYVYTLCIIDE